MKLIFVDIFTPTYSWTNLRNLTHQCVDNYLNWTSNLSPLSQMSTPTIPLLEDENWRAGVSMKEDLKESIIASVNETQKEKFEDEMRQVKDKWTINPAVTLAICGMQIQFEEFAVIKAHMGGNQGTNGH